MSLVKEDNLRKLDPSPLSNPKPKLRLKKRDGSKSRSIVKMPPIMSPSPSIPQSLLKNSPYKSSPKKLRPTFAAETRDKSKPLSFFRQQVEEFATHDVKSTRSINMSKVRRPEIVLDSISTAGGSKDTENDKEPKEKETFSPTKKALQTLTSTPSKTKQHEVNAGFYQAIMDYNNTENKDPATDILVARKTNSHIFGPERKLKNRTPSLGRHYLPRYAESNQFEGIYNKTNTEEEELDLPYIAPTKHSFKGSGVVTAYAANTNQGLVRSYNEDRVSIILNISKPIESTYKGEWPSCSYFAVYDGHGGEACADFLRDNLHQMIVRNSSFPTNPVAALQKGFAEAEAKFLEQADKSDLEFERSGSCALVVLIVDDTCYVANVGDSRAVMSCDKGKRVIDMSRDHKPSDSQEQARIIKNGGRIYQSQASQTVKAGIGVFASSYSTVVLGPYRVWPGRLSVRISNRGNPNSYKVSRTFGDIEAKSPKYEGIPGVIIAEPEIRIFKITEECDFIVLGCDGIYDKLSSEDVAECVWTSTFTSFSNVHQQAAAGVEYIMKQSLLKKTTDNITVVMVALAGFKNATAHEDIEAHTEEDSLQASHTRSKIILTEPAEYSGPDVLGKSHSTKRLHFGIDKRNKDVPMKARPNLMDLSENAAYAKNYLSCNNTRKNKGSAGLFKSESPEVASQIIKLKRRILVSKSKHQDT